MKHSLSIIAVAVLATCSQVHASTLGVQFNIEGLRTQAHAQDPASNLAAKGFDTNFTGSLITTSTRHSQLGGGNSFLGTGWTLTALTATQTFLNGAMLSGNLSLIATHVDGFTDTFDATLKGNRSGRDIFRHEVGGEGFVVASDIASVTLGGFGASNHMFAGLDLSSAYAQDWLGSLLQFRFKPNANGFDAGSDASMILSAVVVPLPTPALMALTGLLPVVVIGLRRRRQGQT